MVGDAREVQRGCRGKCAGVRVLGVAGVFPAGRTSDASDAVWSKHCPSSTGRRQAARLGWGRLEDSTPLRCIVVSGLVSDPPHIPDVPGVAGWRVSLWHLSLFFLTFFFLRLWRKK